jgi:MYXO-CTERM domain-containing protein
MCERSESDAMKHKPALADRPQDTRGTIAAFARIAVLFLISVASLPAGAQLVSVVATDDTAAESPSDSGEFVISSDVPPADSITIQYTVEGSATPGDDYGALNGEVALSPDQFSVSIPVNVPGDDSVFEGEETVVVRLVEHDTVSVSPDTATVTIADSSYSVTVSTTSNAAEDPISAGAFAVSLGARNESGTALDVNYSVGGTATSGTDYEPLSSPATIPVGADSVAVSVTPLGDDEPEDDETVQLTLLSTNDGRVPVGSPATASVSIADGDDAGTAEVIVSVSASSDASETPAVPGAFLIQRVGGSDRAVTIAYSVDGSATPGDDYNTLAGSVSLAEGATEASVPVETKGNDTSLEGDETVRITLLAVENEISVADATATVTIVDSPHSVTASRISNASENPLGVGRLRISLGASNDSGSGLAVSYNVGGTAIPGTDYEALAGTAVIPIGSGQVDIDVTPVDDDLEEDNETVAITLTATDNPDVPVGDPATADLVITDGANGDGPEPVQLSISATDDTAAETPGNPGAFRISRVGGSNRAVTVQYSVNGSATPVEDYTALPLSANLGENVSQTSIEVNVPGDDLVFEGNETVVVSLTGVPDEISVVGGPATVTIQDSTYDVTVTAASNARENPVSPGEFRASLGARNDSGSALSVEYSVAGTATPGTDYQALNGVAVIGSGSFDVAIIVTPLDDALLEDPETVQITVTGTSDDRVPVGDPATASVTIADDDSGNDDDGDGVSNDDECPDPTSCRDTDGDGLPDYQDEDDDGDGVPTARENPPEQDTDGNGTPDYLDRDDDGDGRPTDEEDTNADGDGDPSTNPTDLDGDGVPDYLDADDTGGPTGDADGDGLTNEREEELGTDPLVADTDGDGVDDGTEVDDGTDPLDQSSFADADGDFVPDAVETADGTDPTDPLSFTDTDSGGTADHIETITYANNGIPATDVTDPGDDPRDLDGDGLPDRLELSAGSDPEALDSPTANGAGDDDDDEVSNAVEAWLRTLGIMTVDAVSDLDRDGYPDAREIALGLNPLRASERDDDGDGVPEIVEALAGRDIDASTDSDADGVPDAREIALGTDFLDANVPVVNGSMDDDGDGVTNAIENVLEILGASDEINADTDSDDDGITDADEIRFGTNPFLDEQPAPWIELKQESIGPVNAVLSNAGPAAATAAVGGHQTGTFLYDWSGSDTALLAVTSGDQTRKTLAFSPQTLPAGNYLLVLEVQRTVGGYSSPVSVIELPLFVLANAEPTDVADADADGIPDSADDLDARTGFANELPAGSGTSIQTNTGVRLQLGSAARGSRAISARVTAGNIANAGGEDGGSADNTGDEFDYLGGIYDFEATGLPEVGSVVHFVIPQASPIGEFPEYRKYRPDSGWFDFLEDANNTVASAAGSREGCPAPGDDSYQPGLTTGHFCVQLTIEDGGPNDADAALGPNGVIRDPGGVATPQGEVSVGSGSGNTGPLTVIVLGLLAVAGAAARRRRSRRSTARQIP